MLARSARPASKEETKDIWIKRDMNIEEREKEKLLRAEAKEKTRREQRPRK